MISVSFNSSCSTNYPSLTPQAGAESSACVPGESCRRQSEQNGPYLPTLSDLTVAFDHRGTDKEVGSFINAGNEEQQK